MGNDEELPEGHPLACSRPGCNTRRRVVTPVPLCRRHFDQLRRDREIAEAEDPFLLPDELDDDGQLIVDQIAVETLAKGWRVVRATWTERALATRWILDHHPENAVLLVSERLGISPEVAYQLTESVRNGNAPVAFSVGYGVNIQTLPRRVPE